ncbi:2-amino-4-hydroxy-6-hydroxymethyldihydropteridine diphosphokinase [Rhizobium sp. NTR19]|uniref:2-amino-4-hydroxy-6-hydroxymethyldihydropteridine pyrophosphokinase n=1 Tax=Neorhizobium turbinariae TaxID=2937795 RepID=A0ABT0IWW1_9HYPH|nr:2-amino-4-hydroxy-6-hydroxymethyldihydropteridine diphosphokinase [Neorhizobium turbinariae]MCK8782372.1 2-amino-4-hydroxy-6-hydroxymethyldihydropteridine diphosphokinase [Neorhizobium turbinariae]
MPDRTWEVAALGLGGNIGDPPTAMAEALRQIDRSDDCRVVRVSKLYSTPPWGKLDQADFFNCCALVETVLEPEALLQLCLSIERNMKRVRVERWGPRTIDIDVLTYRNREQKTQTLELPHPRMTERGFVIKPLADIAPEMVLNGRSVDAWLEQVDVTGIRVADDDPDWWRSA